MTLTDKLDLNASKPYAPERERDDISAAELEQLTQDDTYQELAELRCLADMVEVELAHSSDVPNEVTNHVFDAVTADDAPLQKAVDTYVDRWLAAHRAKERHTNHPDQ